MSNELSFEQALSRLEELVKQLEGGNIELDRSLGVFEEAVSLVKLCNGMLDNAEQKIKMLVKKGDGSYAEQDIAKAE